MDAIILAAGLGTRLRPYTEQTPKPLLDVQGRPLLDWAIGALPPAITRVLVVVHYLAEQIEDYLHGQRRIADWVTVRQDAPRGTGDALRACRTLLRSERFLVVNGDDLYGAADLAALASCPVLSAGGLLVQPVDEPRRFGIAYLKADGTLDRLVEKPPLDGRQLANTGAYLFPHDVFATELQVSARGEYEITDYVTALAATRTVSVVPATFWLPIGTVDAWQAAQTIDLETHLRTGR